MKELVTANGQTSACESVLTQPGMILLTVEGLCGGNGFRRFCGNL